MTPEQEAEKARRLRLLESAAASAILNGASPDEARERAEIGIAEAIDLNTRRQAAVADKPPTRPAASGALADWAHSVGA